MQTFHLVSKSEPLVIYFTAFALRPGSVIVHFILYFKTAVTPEKGLENLRAAISSNDSYADFPAKDLLPLSDESTTSATPGSPKPIGIKE